MGHLAPTPQGPGQVRDKANNHGLPGFEQPLSEKLGEILE